MSSHRQKVVEGIQKCRAVKANCAEVVSRVDHLLRSNEADLLSEQEAIDRLVDVVTGLVKARTPSSEALPVL
jgi:hypothetical protein